MRVLSLVVLLAPSRAAPTPAEVAAGVARASTPLRARPVSQAIAQRALAPYGGDLTSMWAQAAAADGNKSTNCRAWMLQYEHGLRLMPERAPLRDVFDALQLGVRCGVSPPTAPASTSYFKPLTSAEISAACPTTAFYVDPAAGNDGGAGTRAAPFKTLPRAVAATRAGGTRAPGAAACIVLRPGVHFLGATVELGAADSGLVVTALAGDPAPAWVSGGVPLGPMSWAPHDTVGQNNIYVADVPEAVPVSAMPGLQTLAAGADPTRLWRAMYPNWDMEQFSGDLPGDREVAQWVKPPIMDIPTLVYKDLKAAGLKNDSTMRDYNIYAAGKGGPCEHWGRVNDDMWCVCKQPPRARTRAQTSAMGVPRAHGGLLNLCTQFFHPNYPFPPFFGAGPTCAVTRQRAAGRKLSEALPPPGSWAFPSPCTGTNRNCLRGCRRGRCPQRPPPTGPTHRYSRSGTTKAGTTRTTPAKPRPEKTNP
jgi:hypothetical protein